MKLRELLFLMDFNTKFNLVIDNNKNNFECENLFIHKDLNFNYQNQTDAYLDYQVFAISQNNLYNDYMNIYIIKTKENEWNENESW